MPMAPGAGKPARAERWRTGAVCALLWGAAVLCAASVRAGPLYRSLDRPDKARPPLITLGPTLGGSPDWEMFRFGFSGSILFRPDAAAGIFAPLYYWNTGLVLHGEYRDIAPDRNILTADLVLRRYLVDGHRRSRGTALFAGAGGGLALVGYPVAVPAGDSAAGEAAADAAPQRYQRGEQRYYTFLAELGYEQDMTDSIVLLWKAQWRGYIWGSRDYSNWSLHVQIGFPLPW
ncbi:hypothetical protein KKG45_03565 [bacterium]|nr:hypothetical protein [bacterium]MBU1072304.1 hypothetical protein [bacterium]MBU1675614.1 hypothetical protein [bacterium]